LLKSQAWCVLWPTRISRDTSRVRIELTSTLKRLDSLVKVPLKLRNSRIDLFPSKTIVVVTTSFAVFGSVDTTDSRIVGLH
jgi:hypothetical protein